MRRAVCELVMILGLELIPLELVQRCPERIQSQLRGVRRSLRQAAHRGDERVAFEGSSFAQSLPIHQFSQSRCAGHRGHASLGLESDLRNAPRLDFQSQTKYISASRVLNLRHGVGVRNFAGVARILKMIEQLRGIHTVQIVAGRAPSRCSCRRTALTREKYETIAASPQ